jgi:hypothetical protein
LRGGVMKSFMICSGIERRRNEELHDMFRDGEEA